MTCGKHPKQDFGTEMRPKNEAPKYEPHKRTNPEAKVRVGANDSMTEEWGD
jgi:hypothetical protein